MRVQSEADLAARDPWRIDAWENPFARDGPASPFLAGEPMLEAEGSATIGYRALGYLGRSPSSVTRVITLRWPAKSSTA